LSDRDRPVLPRTLGLPLLVLYGLGVIIGAGIYVLIGTVVAQAGMAAPLAFVLAGAVAALTGLSYAELAARFPEAAGAPVYIRHAFGSDRLSQVAGLAVAAIIAISAAAIARGSAGYMHGLTDLPEPLLGATVVAAFTGLACLPVRQSVGFAAAITVVEVGGLLLIVAVGLPGLADFPARAHEMIPAGIGGWSGVAVGGFLAFFAFIGFENLANMAEEARAPERSLPRALLLSLAISTALYAAVAVVTVLAAPLAELAGSAAPLMLVAERASWFSADVFAAIALIAVANGVLIELVTLARLLYGMARRGWLPDTLGTVHPSTQTPVKATLCGGLIVFVLAVVLPFLSLVSLTNSITLLVFAMVNAALWRLQQVAPRQSGFRVPRAIPPLAIILTLALAGAQWVQ
jgi:APA family basic amino acid/polyamine antiporter